MIGGDQQLVVRDDPRRAVDDLAVLEKKAGFREPRAAVYPRAGRSARG
jgi:hypothetical protein